ncbi:uncharacterized protein LOC115762358 [Drosophila novamexicana]|uniref:uncharacterized protein LOC115762358 n=1 Tax=Drosophila novamexicana TaxID=47314 RepID=UPI0011E592A8|nr:uncharacterized protein LOC115762358 [Drosophila novamexicana]
MFKTFLLLFLAATPTGSARFKLTGLECQALDPKFCAFENCVIKPVSRGIKEINGKIILLQVPIRLELTRRGYVKHMLYAVDIDGCQFWIGKRRNPIASSIYKSLRLDVFTNINHSCPYNHDIIVDHLRLDENLNLNLPIAIHFEVARRGYIKHMLYAGDIDGCHFWIGKRRNPIASSIYKSLRLDVFTNINHSCPYNHDLILDHLRIDENLNLNLPIAVGEYMIKLHWRAYNILRAIVSWNLQIE